MNRRDFVAATASTAVLLTFSAPRDSVEIGRKRGYTTILHGCGTCSRDMTHAHIATSHDPIRLLFRHGVCVESQDGTVGLILRVYDGVTEEEIRSAFAEAVTRFQSIQGFGHRDLRDYMLRAGLEKNGIDV